ncbi:tRNA(m5U54)methyltransferase [Arachnomyces sp. PD_36]|nr:tRNA(m5U54)methyltransferase [Arachnomyces sp. PD_36]
MRDQRGDGGRKKSKLEKKKVQEGGTDEVLQLDVNRLLGRHAPTPTSAEQTPDGGDAESSRPELPVEFTEIEVKISELSSTGDGLALSPTQDHVYVVPFTLPGDTAKVKVIRHSREARYTMTDFLSVVEPSPQRDDSLIGCKYFSKCSGCQLQMLPYADQLAHKKKIVEKAYANFSGLIPELIPAVQDTMPSPLEYGYRTKLTPHFGVPNSARKNKGARPVQTQTEVPAIGYTYKNRRQNIDIEDCPLGTDIVRQGLKSERKRVIENLHTFKRGATLLLRESTTREKKQTPETEENKSKSPAAELPQDENLIRKEYPDYVEEKRCVTESNKTSVEYVGDYVFYNKAGAFFQNNNSILEPFTSYIRDHALPPSTAIKPGEPPIKYLLDAYSGSGLFTVTLSPLFKSSLGVDVSDQSIISARENARANNLSNTGFAAADAATIFKNIPYPPDQTVLVIDPSRKGCDDSFISQMLSFGPRRVIYVSCNVHTQARDVGAMVLGDKNWRYEIESIKGFDFFPQTGHVEGVAVLNRAPAAAKEDGESSASVAVEKE